MCSRRSEAQQFYKVRAQLHSLAQGRFSTFPQYSDVRNSLEGLT